MSRFHEVDDLSRNYVVGNLFAGHFAGPVQAFSEAQPFTAESLFSEDGTARISAGLLFGL